MDEDVLLAVLTISVVVLFFIGCMIAAWRRSGEEDRNGYLTV